ncbi:unnamed protein product [Kluyveromyces dobzhanskii CBS 2104]|uniref:WGS project CCBQ000000000 data, contig 00272 n=1 Tax=Kluyveromyces dobzhanskii CBS 2104 TaxID=1427455 RepID=A0A0A8LAN6_9SACH|nr:unnamed protein product [Kluyveromyces dobzhanskii CBS 2104]
MFTNTDLVESLENFHITSPEKVNTVRRPSGDFESFMNSDDFEDDNVQFNVQGSPMVNGIIPKKNKKNELKPYKENENPLPQQFGSFLSKMDEWSVNYGTVKATKGDPKRNGETTRGLSNLAEENNGAPQAQWRNYLLKPKQNNNHHQSPKDVSDLIVTASLSDLSLIPADTFKKKEKSDFSNMSHETDPAREAKSVFKNVLKHQRSNYFRDNDTPEANSHTKSVNAAGQSYQARNYIGATDSGSISHSVTVSESESESESQAESESVDYDSGSDSEPKIRQDSVINPSNINSPSPKPRTVTNTRRLPLITPEDAGLVFDHETGLWDKQRMAQTANSNVSTSSSSSFVMEGDSTTSHSNSTGTVKNGGQDTFTTETPKRKNGVAAMRVPPIVTINGDTKNGIHDEEYSREGNTSTNTSASTNTVTDDTPLSTPKFNRNFFKSDTRKLATTRQPSSSLHKELSSTDLHGHGDADGNVGDVTNVSQMDTSYDLTKREIMSRILEIEPNPANWQTLYEVDLSDQAIRDSCIGINELLPNLIDLDVSNNELISLQGIPKRIQTLCIAKNKLRTQLIQFQDLPHVEHLDISANNLSALQDLRITAPLSHLRCLDVSNTGINSLMGLPKFARLDTLIARDNRLIGSIDFKRLYESSPIPWRHVTKLDLSNNTITNLKNLHYLTSLRVLVLDGNSIERLHSRDKKKGPGNPELRYLSLRNAAVPLHSLSGFPNLRILRFTVPTDLNHNKNHSPTKKTINWESTDAATCSSSIPLPASKRYPLPFPLEQLEIVGATSTTTTTSTGDSSANDSVQWEQFCFPPQLRRATLQQLGLTRVPASLTTNSALSSLDLQRNDLYSAQILLPSLPHNLLRLNIRGNPVLDPAEPAEPVHTARFGFGPDRTTKHGPGNAHAVALPHTNASSNTDLLSLVLHWCPALVECDLQMEGYQREA